MKYILYLFVCISSLIHAQSNYYHPLDWDFDFGITGGPLVQSIESKTYALTTTVEIGQLLSEQEIVLEDGKLSTITSFQHTLDYGFEQRFYYDENDALTKREHFDKHGFLQEQIQYSYHPDHEDMIKTIVVNEFSADEPTATANEFNIVYELDEAGRRIKETTFKEDNTVRSTVVFSYNEMGMIESKKRFNPTGEWRWTDSLVYNDLRRVTKEVTILPGLNDVKQRELVHTYDDDFNKIGRKIGGTKQEFDLIFDSHGNWISKTIYNYEKVSIKGEDNTDAEVIKKPYTITKRTITYLTN